MAKKCIECGEDIPAVDHELHALLTAKAPRVGAGEVRRCFDCVIHRLVPPAEARDRQAIELN